MGPLVTAEPFMQAFVQPLRLGREVVSVEANAEGLFTAVLAEPLLVDSPPEGNASASDSALTSVSAPELVLQFPLIAAQDGNTPEAAEIRSCDMTFPLDSVASMSMTDRHQEPKSAGLALSSGLDHSFEAQLAPGSDPERWGWVQLARSDDLVAPDAPRVDVITANPLAPDDVGFPAHGLTSPQVVMPVIHQFEGGDARADSLEPTRAYPVMPVPEAALERETASSLRGPDLTAVVEPIPNEPRASLQEENSPRQKQVATNQGGSVDTTVPLIVDRLPQLRESVAAPALSRSKAAIVLDQAPLQDIQLERPDIQRASVPVKPVSPTGQSSSSEPIDKVARAEGQSENAFAQKPLIEPNSVRFESDVPLPEAKQQGLQSAQVNLYLKATDSKDLVALRLQKPEAIEVTLSDAPMALPPREGGSYFSAVSGSVFSAPPAQGVPMELARSLAQQVSTALAAQPDRPVELLLSPEELGKVRLTLNSSESGITVSVLTERPETLDLMRRHIDLLARDFRDLGYSSIAFNFGASPEHGRGARDREASEKPEGSSRRESEPAAPLAGPIPLKLSLMPEQGLDLRM